MYVFQYNIIMNNRNYTTISVGHETNRRLNCLKLDLRLRSAEKVIEYLLDKNDKS